VHGKTIISFGTCWRTARAWRRGVRLPAYQRDRKRWARQLHGELRVKEFAYEEIHRRSLSSAATKTSTRISDSFCSARRSKKSRAWRSTDTAARKIFDRSGCARLTTSTSRKFARGAWSRFRHVRADRNVPSRKRLLVGEVDDENAFAMGGVAGHAGLFAPVREVDRIASELIACYAGRRTSCREK